MTLARSTPRRRNQAKALGSRASVPSVHERERGLLGGLGYRLHEHASVALIALVIGCAIHGGSVTSPDTGSIAPPNNAPAPEREVVGRFEGEASYYADSLVGHPTASGEPYRRELLTAAHPSLPFGTLVRVTRVDGEASVLCRINDRGPFGRRKRVLDLSRAAAEQLGLVQAGVARVRVEVLASP